MKHSNSIYRNALIAAAFGLAAFTPAHAVSVVSWQLADFNADGLASDFSFSGAPSGKSAFQFGLAGETGCVNASDGNNCDPIRVDGSAHAINQFTTGFFFASPTSGRFGPNIINGGILADISGSSLTFSRLDWGGIFPTDTTEPGAPQFFIPPNTFESSCADITATCVGAIDYGLVMVETLTDLGNGNYGVVVRWQGRILTPAGNVESPFGAFVGHWRLEGVMSTVPVPAAVWLLGSGLLGLIGVAARKKVRPAGRTSNRHCVLRVGPPQPPEVER